MVIHGAFSLIRFYLSISSSFSCLSPSSSSTLSCSLSSTTRSSWQTCAAPLQKRVRTPRTPLPLSQNPYTAGRARSLLRENLSPTRAKLPELVCAIEKMEDIVRRYSSRRDAHGNAHSLAENIRMSSFEALFPDDLEKHIQLNRARLTSYGVLREEINTYCECRGHANARNMKQKGSSHPGGDDTMDIGAFGKGKGKQGKGQARQGQRQRQSWTARTARTRTRTRTRARIRLNVGIVENVDTTRKTVGARRTPTKVVRRENTKPRMQMLTILTRNHQLLNQKSKSMNSA